VRRIARVFRYQTFEQGLGHVYIAEFLRRQGRVYIHILSGSRIAHKGGMRRSATKGSETCDMVRGKTTSECESV
jgi:hypothetical protein